MSKLVKTGLYWLSVFLVIPTYYAIDYFMKLYNEFGVVQVDSSMSLWVYAMLVWCISTFIVMITKDNDWRKTNNRLEYVSKVCGENNDALTLIAEIIITNQLDLIELFDEQTRKLILGYAEKGKNVGDINE